MGSYEEQWRQSRIFNDFYPQRLGSSFHLTRSHSVTSLGFRTLDDFVFQYAIESPSAKQGERRYSLPFTEYILDDSIPERVNNFFQGKIGESLMRIIMNEFLRRQSDRLGLSDFGFLKWNKNPRSPNLVLAENGIYRAEHIDRYNVVVLDTTNITTRTIIAEYDGVLEYSYFGTYGIRKGLFVCEAKTGDLGYLGLHNRKDQKNKNLVRKRIIEPLKVLFPEHQIDYVIMAHERNLFSIRKDTAKYRKLHKGLANLYHYLLGNDIGLLLFTFNETKTSIDARAREIVDLRHAVMKNGKRIEEFAGAASDQVYLESDDDLILIKGRRIDAIYRKGSNGNLTMIYSYS